MVKEIGHSSQANLISDSEMVITLPVLMPRDTSMENQLGCHPPTTTTWHTEKLHLILFRLLGKNRREAFTFWWPYHIFSTMDSSHHVLFIAETVSLSQH